MKHLKIFENFNLSERDAFVDYIMSFYGPDGTWSEFFDHKLTKDIVEKYVDKFINKRETDFDGDSFDRELFRDFLLVKLGISDINEVELNISSFFSEAELKEAELLHRAFKYNL